MGFTYPVTNWPWYKWYLVALFFNKAENVKYPIVTGTHTVHNICSHIEKSWLGRMVLLTKFVNHIAFLQLLIFPDVRSLLPLIVRFMGPTWGPSGADRTQVGPMLAPWTLLSGTLQCRPSQSGASVNSIIEPMIFPPAKLTYTWIYSIPSGDQYILLLSYHWAPATNIY